MKHVAIGDFLTTAQIEEAQKLKEAKLICEKIIKPNIGEINRKLGQENDLMYLAYMLEYAIRRVNG